MSVDLIPTLSSSRRTNFVSQELSGSDSATPRRGYITGFRDTIIKLEEDDVDLVDPESPRLAKAFSEKSKQIIVLVGLPGRGKTFLCNKLLCYLNWLGHRSRIFNVGAYRRQLKTGENEAQDAHFFDPHNSDGMRARQQALDSALDDLIEWLTQEPDNQVAIFDATNSTEERRRYLRSKFHGRFQYLFIESICNDEATLERNYLLKMKYSPDYQGVDTAKALQDFKDRVKMYEKVYQPMTDGVSNRDLHFIQLVDMVTGRGHMDINRISGYIPGKIVFFLMQVCKSGLTAGRRIWLSRHGESIYNSLGKIGGDASLTANGLAYSERLPQALMPRLPPNCVDPEGLVTVSVWTSTLARTIETAASLPFPKLRWKALDEIHAGVCDGMTYEEIKQLMPEVHAGRKADKLRYRYPSGESYLDVIQRLEPVVMEAEREKESVVIIGHQAIIRVLYGYFLDIHIDDIPELEIPLHTLIELEPRPDGTMTERRFKVNINCPLGETAKLFSETQQGGTRSPGSVGDDTPLSPGKRLGVDTRRRAAFVTDVVDKGGVRSPLFKITSRPSLSPGRDDGDALAVPKSPLSFSSCASPEDLAPSLYASKHGFKSVSSCASSYELAPGLYGSDPSNLGLDDAVGEVKNSKNVAIKERRA